MAINLGTAGVILRRLRYPALVLALGLFLLLLPKGQKDSPVQSAEPAEDPLTLSASDLEDILSQVSGAGRVRVLLSLEATRQEIYATDTDTQGQGDGSGLRQTEKHILYGAGSGVQAPLILGADAPAYRGAVVVCQGADDPAVRLALTQAVAGLTGLRSNQIVIMKMK